MDSKGRSLKTQLADVVASLSRLPKAVVFSVGITAIGLFTLLIVAGLHFLLAAPIGILCGYLNYLSIRHRAKWLMAKTWTCAKCDQQFKIDDWTEVAFVWAHLNTCKVRCPHCQEKSYCRWE